MIRKQLIDKSQHSTKCPYTITPEGISVHNTGNTATAQNERDNLNRADNKNEVSFHYVTDEKETIQCVETNRNTWANSDYSKGWKSKNYINWEICYSKNYDNSAIKEKFDKAEMLACKDIARVLFEKGWGVDKVKNHSTFDPSSCCPKITLQKGWERFIKMIQKELDILNGTSGETLYRVQVGAYKKYGNAENMVMKLKSLGIESYITK